MYRLFNDSLGIYIEMCGEDSPNPKSWHLRMIMDLIYNKTILYRFKRYSIENI